VLANEIGKKLSRAYTMRRIVWTRVYAAWLWQVVAEITGSRLSHNARFLQNLLRFTGGH
jgi:hypothetical protein